MSKCVCVGGPHLVLEYYLWVGVEYWEYCDKMASIFNKKKKKPQNNYMKGNDPGVKENKATSTGILRTTISLGWNLQVTGVCTM